MQILRGEDEVKKPAKDSKARRNHPKKGAKPNPLGKEYGRKLAKKMFQISKEKENTDAD